jgi:hypothetical protein
MRLTRRSSRMSMTVPRITAPENRLRARISAAIPGSASGSVDAFARG